MRKVKGTEQNVDHSCSVTSAPIFVLLFQICRSFKATVNSAFACVVKTPVPKIMATSQDAVAMVATASEIQIPSNELNWI